MKRKFIGVLAGLILLGMTGMAQASLTTIGTAWYGPNEYKLIWDDDNNGQSVVWLDYSHTQSTWDNQKYWAEVILGEVLIMDLYSSYSVEWTSTWRLPYAGLNPLRDYNQTSSEMGHLFYEELGLLSYADRNDDMVTNDELNTSNFDNLIASWYWSVADYDYIQDVSGRFMMNYGYQGPYNGPFIDGGYGLAVRSGQVSTVPVPGTIVFLASGLVGLVSVRTRRNGNRC